MVDMNISKYRNNKIPNEYTLVFYLAKELHDRGLFPVFEYKILKSRFDLVILDNKNNILFGIEAKGRRSGRFNKNSSQIKKYCMINSFPIYYFDRSLIISEYVSDILNNKINKKYIINNYITPQCVKAETDNKYNPNG